MTAQIISETVSERLVYKRYATATYDANSEPVAATDPAATGGQVWRHTNSFKMGFSRTNYSPKEIRIDQVQPIDKPGSQFTTVSIPTLLSCLTHKSQIEDVLGGTWSSSAISKSNADYTSLAADATAGTLTLGGGDPVSDGFFAGDVIRPTNLSESANNRDFTILSFSGSNRVLHVYPFPTTMSADTSFALDLAGRSIISPATAPIKRKVALEEYQGGPNIARLGTEITLGGFELKIPANAPATLDFTGMGRNIIPYDSGSAPFFSGPTVQTTTDPISGMQGILVIGSLLVPITGLSIKFNRPLSAKEQIRSDGLAAGIVASDNAVCDGDFSAWMTDTTVEQTFKDATEFSILAVLPSSNAANSPAMTFYLARCLKTSADVSESGGSKTVSCKFSAGRPSSSVAGVADTAIRITDTEVT